MTDAIKAAASQRKPLTLAVFQCASQPLDVAGNLERMERVALQARAQGADLLLVPEMFVGGYSIGAEAVQQLAQSREGAYRHGVAHIARTAGLAIVFGYPERGEDGHVFNAAQWIDAQGEVVLNYRKTHLYGTLDRIQFSAEAVSESNAALCDIKGWKLGVLICYDVEFPENTRRLALAGADCILVPTANMDTYDFVPDTLVPTRAFENQVVLAYANYCGAEGSMRYGGLSSVVDALGQPLAKAARTESLLIATLTPEALADARSKQTHLQEHAERLQQALHTTPH
jgi:predicted amidohydrolase